MNVLYVLNRFPKLSESFVINEIHELESRGHTVAVFSLRRPEGNLQQSEVDRLDAEVGYLPDPSPSSALGTLGAWWLDPPVLRATLHTAPPVAHAGAAYVGAHCLRFVRGLEFEVDHVHGHFLNWPKLGASYVSTHLDVPCTVTAHAYDLYSSETDLPGSSTNERLVRVLADRMDRIVTISEYNRTYLREEVGTSSPVDVVHMGIDLDKFEPSARTRPNRILSVARFDEKKGIEHAVEAVAQVADDLPDLEYHLVGSGPREEAVRELISEHGLEDTVELLGRVSDDRLVRELDEARVFVLPSVIASDGDRDGIPVALMEAIAMETIPVSTTVSGIPELIENGETGFLVPPRDTEALAEVLVGIFGDDPDYEIQPTALRETIAREFAVEGCVTALLESFETVRNEFTDRSA